ncbi:hypothetical protein [Streptomyces sp. cg36]|uniref:hypothetical protein n=1 Tax=Streptomyces sp. cg36 TaxID=3238798 RepID=UPI0034E29E87
MDLKDLRHDLDILLRWQHHPWPDMVQAAGAAATRLWDGLHEAGRWQALPDHDHAAVSAALASAYCLRSALPTRVTEQQWGPRLAPLARELAYFATWLDPDTDCWRYALPDRAQQATDAVRLHRELLALPDEWQAEALRRTEPERAAPWRPTPPAPPALDAVLDRCARARYRTPTWVDEPGADGPGTTYLALEILHTLLALPRGWQIECVRQISGGESPTGAVTRAALARNLLRPAAGMERRR